MTRWHEVYDFEGAVRQGYQPLLHRLNTLSRADLRALEESMDAALREMGVSFPGYNDRQSQQPWRCDLLPHIFAEREWQTVVLGIRQRLKAFELFLRDVYGKRDILRSGAIPIHPVLGSPHYLNASIDLPLPQGAYLHLCGIRLERGPSGALMVQHHQFSRASGISYMMQNRRALARVLPESFQEASVQSIAAVPLALIESLRGAAAEPLNDPSVVLLSAGLESPVYSDHSFLARRMGIPVVQGGDLLVLDDRVYLKTVRGLKRVDVIYNQIADEWLDPLVFKKGSHLGVPGLVHCVRRGTVALLNATGSHLADDRALLSFAPKIIRFYLNEDPILPSTPTHWLGDLDQCEMVLDQLDRYRVSSVDSGELSPHALRKVSDLVQAIRKEPSRYVAQPRPQGVMTARFEDGRLTDSAQDHLIFALRNGDGFEVFPGALTRVFTNDSGAWVTKDSRVPGENPEPSFAHPRARRFTEISVPSREVTSRVAESFYWMGRYLERAYHQAYLIQVVETLETEELNSAERKLYRPMWNRLLPPLEKSTGTSRRSITTRLDRYRLVLLKEPGTVVSAFDRAMANAQSVQESLSPEAWATLSDLATLFHKSRYRPKLSEAECAGVTRKVAEAVTQRIPQFFAVAARTVLGDDGWRFCEAGEALERALISANAVLAIGKSLVRPPHEVTIELSAFLRLLGTRDAYRRIYQMRSEPIAVLELIWQHPEAPRSVFRCLQSCLTLLRESAPHGSDGATKAVAGIEHLLHRIRRVDWSEYIRHTSEEETTAEATSQGDARRLLKLMNELLGGTLDIHNLISDGFLSHQAYIAEAVQPLLQGLVHGI